MRLPGLDGLRGVSILLVMLLHTAQSPFFPDWLLLKAIATRGGFGVDIFFVISGFLITSLLLNEERKFETIDLKRFYLRRAFRILPPAFVYLSMVLAFGMLGWISINGRELLASAFFFRNFISGGTIETAHFWTLSIEEQFYLFWPFVLFFLKSPDKRLKAAIVLVLLAPCWRQINYYFFSAESVNPWRTDLRYDPLLVGCVVALLRERVGARRVLQSRPLNTDLAFSVCVLLVIGSLTDFSFSLPGEVRFAFGILRILLVALILNYLVNAHGRFFDRFFRMGWLVYLGKLSYSLYIWGQLFCYHYEPGVVRNFPQNVFFALLAAALSYHVVEQPFLRWRERLKI